MRWRWYLAALLLALGVGSVLSKAPDPQALQLGEQVYNQVCARCHRDGVTGAPRLCDPEAWTHRLPKGVEVLVRNTLNGYMGNRGVMPPRGGEPTLSDEEVAAAVRYMMEMSNSEKCPPDR